MSPRFTSLILATAVLTSCSTQDEIHQAALRASYEGTRAGLGRNGRDTAGLDAASKVVERYYWVAKYKATPEQRAIAIANARKVEAARKRLAKNSTKKLSRYIAVETKRDERAQTETSVMVWDTESQLIVENDIYDLNRKPPRGALVKFDTWSAEYVGQLSSL